jgi:hypothetical protein
MRTPRVAALAVAALALAPAAPAQARVLVVGDSLQVGSGPYVERALPGTPVTVDARIGRPSVEGVSVLRSRLRAAHEVVVFDLGTNNDPAAPARLGRDLAAARAIAGRRCLVVATINRPPLNGVSYAQINRVIQRFAASDPNTQLVDWRAYATRQRGLLAPDRIHATARGYAVRGQLIARGAQACLIGAPSDDPAAPPGQTPEAPEIEEVVPAEPPSRKRGRPRDEDLGRRGAIDPKAARPYGAMLAVVLAVAGDVSARRLG